MILFELAPADISNLNDSDLRELVARLCEAELSRQGVSPVHIKWGGAQEAPDGGLDVYVQDVSSLPSPGFVPRTNTGIQVKKNSMSKAACVKEMQDSGNVKKSSLIWQTITVLTSLSAGRIVAQTKCFPIVFQAWHQRLRVCRIRKTLNLIFIAVTGFAIG